MVPFTYIIDSFASFGKRQNWDAGNAISNRNQSEIFIFIIDFSSFRRYNQYKELTQRKQEQRMPCYTIGIDYGSLSGRAVLVDTANGQEVASAELAYPHQTWIVHCPVAKP